MAGDTELTDGIAAEVKRKIEDHENGDTERLILIMLLAIHKDIRQIKTNPAVKLGNFYTQYPKLAVISFIVANIAMWVIAVSTILTYAKTMGLIVAIAP